ncbi:MAG: NAD(P) transhydrogenase subunit alpha [Methylococcaceae bacterium NSP1-1]|nr:MAG: NAD(P) transhydrogenase subunit alpha [Methylococcaceae bacterium NSP1-1]
MKIGIPKEIHQGEKRVATTPEAAAQIIKLGFSVSIESGAGLGADISDEAYKEAGVEIVPDTRTLWKQSDIVMKVRAPERNLKLAIEETDLLSAGYGQCTAYVQSAKAGCVEFHGQYCRLQGHR